MAAKLGQGQVMILENTRFYKEEKQGDKEFAGKLASLVGRYYAMDRDKRWDRVKMAYDMLVHGKGHHSTDILESMNVSYTNGITDEFIEQ